MKYFEIMSSRFTGICFQLGWEKNFREKLITSKWKLILFNIQFYFNSVSPEVTGKPDLLNYSRDIMNTCFHLHHLFFNKT